jgi:hypothetical protein
MQFNNLKYAEQCLGNNEKKRSHNFSKNESRFNVN